MKRARIAAAMLLVMASLELTTARAADPPPRASYGRQEHVRVIEATPIEIVSVLEPDAAYSILNAVDIKYFQRETNTWVRFTIDNGSVLQGKRVTLERRVLKDYKIPQRDGGFEHQPQVAIELCLGAQDFKTEVRLVERQGYTAPLVLGRPDLARRGSVDSQRQFTQEPRCGAAPSKFQCDGRTYCSQMTSCEEAKFFLHNCPAVKMDGDHDGIPCEQQWCH